MSYSKSVFDTIADAMAPTMRKLNDIKLSIFTGTKTTVLRVTTVKDNMFGDETSTYNSHEIANVEISYPFNSIDSLISNDTDNSDIGALSITDLIPITMKIPFEGTNDANFDRNDYIVDILKSSRGKAIPIVFTGPKATSSFYGKVEVQREYELTLQRGDLEDDLQAIVDAYKTSVGVPQILSSDPADGETGVNVSGTVQLTFDTPMNVVETDSILDASFSFVPSWDESGLVMTLTPETYLSSGTVYTVEISNNSPISDDGFALDESYSMSFTTT